MPTAFHPDASKAFRTARPRRPVAPVMRAVFGMTEVNGKVKEEESNLETSYQLIVVAPVTSQIAKQYSSTR